MGVPFALVRDLSPEDDESQRKHKRSAGSPAAASAPSASADGLQVLWEALREVEDPEIPISVVDMGLVVSLEQHAGTVAMKLTFTAMGCPAMEMILDDIRARLLQVPGVEQVQIEVVWDPPWTPARLTEEGRDTMRMWGIGI
ncbi:MAG TPA: metal-sulfur cluster assembly factor [Ktedonobacterales bacterium]|jgi:metal-sulfur cluster biosynthetic enzyme